MSRRVLVTGGAGYVGAVLVPRLLERGWAVTVVDRYWYGEHVLDAVSGSPGLTQVRGDIRDLELLEQHLPGCEGVIHLACISNDPSFELDPELGRAINYDAFEPLVCRARDAGIRRFVYASSSSVYGVKETSAVTEDMALEPLTDYSRYKATCEEVLRRYEAPDFTTVTLRPATVCGYSPRQRLDVIVNILTNHAVNRGTIRVFGGGQLRPNLHIQDMAAAYETVLEAPKEQVAGEVFNAGGANHSVEELAELVRRVVADPRLCIERVPTDDPRSYHIASDRIAAALGFEPTRSVEDGVRDLCRAFALGRLPDPLGDPRYYNVRTLRALSLAGATRPGA